MHTEIIPAGPETDAVLMWRNGELIGIASSPQVARETFVALQQEIAAMQRRSGVTARLRPRRQPRRKPQEPSRIIGA